VKKQGWYFVKAVLAAAKTVLVAAKTVLTAWQNVPTLWKLNLELGLLFWTLRGHN